MNKDNKNTELDNTDKKLHISDVMVGILSYENVDEFKNKLNAKMKLVFGVDDWIDYGKFDLIKYYGQEINEVEKIISYIDRDANDFEIFN